MKTHVRRDGGALHLVYQITYFLEVSEAGAIRVKCAIAC